MSTKLCNICEKGVHWPELGHLLGPHHKLIKRHNNCKSVRKSVPFTNGNRKLQNRQSLEIIYIRRLRNCDRGSAIVYEKGEVVILSRQEYDDILFEKELLQEFQESVKFEELIEARSVVDRLDKKFASRSESLFFQKGRKRLRKFSVMWLKTLARHRLKLLGMNW